MCCVCGETAKSKAARAKRINEAHRPWTDMARLVTGTICQMYATQLWRPEKG